MEQVIPFDVNKAGTTKYLCQTNVRKGYGIGPKYPSALADWQHNQQHKDRNFPSGVSVPVYFNWTGTVDGIKKNWGHVAVSLPDGRIWTDGRYYNNVVTLMSNYLSGGNPSFLGWGESVNSVRVINEKEQTNMPSLVKDNMDVARMMMVGILGRKPYDVHVLHKDDEYLKGKANYSLEQLARELYASPEGKDFEKALQTTKVLEPGTYIVK